MSGQRTSAGPILNVRELRVDFMAGDHRIQAVRGVDFAIPTGGTLGIVGESGSGKSITMRAVLGLLPGNARVAGSVRFCGEELIGATPQRLRAIRGARIGMIFQDPMTALNPLHTVGAQIVEAIRIHDSAISQRAARDRAVELLSLVAIPFPERRIDQYPHEFSGGMRQRVVIAIAVANNPELLIADEPTTALDVTVQAQILDVLARLQQERGVSLALITHDLGVVAGVADQVAVMYGGRIVERSAAAEIFYRSKHPYTRGLLGATPTVDKPVARLAAIDGAPPSLATRPSGCAFRPRCPLATPRCAAEDPPMRAVGAGFTACHHAELLSENFSPNSQPSSSQPGGGPRAVR